MITADDIAPTWVNPDQGVEVESTPPMKLFWKQVLVLSLATQAIACNQLPANASETGWLIKQMSDEFGPLEVLAGTSGVKITCMRGQCQIVSKKPTWDVVIYNSKDKRGFKMLRNDWVHDSIQSLGSIRKHYQKDKEIVSQLNAFGFSAKKHLVKTEFVRPIQSTEVWRSESKQTQKKVVSVYYTDVEKLDPCPKEAIEFMIAFYKTPREGGFPLDVVYTKVDSTKDYIVKTLSCTKVTIPANSFEYKTGFKTAATPEAVIFGKVMEGLLEEMLN